MKDVSKEFKPSSWAINNRTAVYILTIIITLAGLMAYNSLPKEKFPEIKFPQIIVQTVYPGTSPENMENLVTKQIEKQVKNLTGVKKVTSNSFQDYSVVIVEFNPDVQVDKAKQDVKDGVDKAKQDLPKNLPYQPEVKDIDLSEFPILSVNISGNYDLNRLKKYADRIKDNIEALKEIKRCDMVGGPEREIQINVDLYKMEGSGITFSDIQNTISAENLSASAGEISMNNQKRVLSIRNEYKNADQMGNTIIRNQHGNAIYLKDIAEVTDSFAEQKSYARLDGKNVITLNVIKAKGKNLIDASDNVSGVVAKMKKKRTARRPENCNNRRPVTEYKRYLTRPYKYNNHWLHTGYNNTYVLHGSNQCIICGAVCAIVLRYSIPGNARNRLHAQHDRPFLFSAGAGHCSG